MEMLKSWQVSVESERLQVALKTCVLTQLHPTVVPRPQVGAENRCQLASSLPVSFQFLLPPVVPCPQHSASAVVCRGW